MLILPKALLEKMGVEVNVQSSLGTAIIAAHGRWPF